MGFKAALLRRPSIPSKKPRFPNYFHTIKINITEKRCLHYQRYSSLCLNPDTLDKQDSQDVGEKQESKSLYPEYLLILKILIQTKGELRRRAALSHTLQTTNCRPKKIFFAKRSSNHSAHQQ